MDALKSAGQNAASQTGSGAASKALGGGGASKMGGAAGIAGIASVATDIGGDALKKGKHVKYRVAMGIPSSTSYIDPSFHFIVD